MLKKIQHLVEYALIILVFGFFKLLGMHKASDFGGWLARTFGKYIKANKTAQKNIKLIFPDMSDSEIDSTCIKMWDNLGRMAAESAFISQMPINEFKKIVKLNKKPKIPKNCLILSGHYGNFEIASKACEAFGVKVNMIYRNANNPYVENLIVNQRESQNVKLYKKGKASLRKIIQIASEKKEAIGMLIDQKTNSGITIPFLGHDAKTTPFPANLAKKYNLPVLVIFMKRINKVEFEINFTDIMRFKETENTAKIMTKLNNIIGDEIKKAPEQWFWVHNRWK